VECEAGPLVDSPSTHLRSPGAHPRLGWVLVKAGVGRGERKVSSTQKVVVLRRQDIKVSDIIIAETGSSTRDAPCPLRPM
jgi:hypothetical protein